MNNKNHDIYISNINHWKDKYKKADKRIVELEEALKEISRFYSYGFTENAEFASLYVSEVVLRVLGEGADECEWKKSTDGPSLVYRTSCRHVYGIWDWKNLEKCPACGKPIHISEGAQMSEYPKAKMPDYGDGPEPCEDCAIKDKRIAELKEENAHLKEELEMYSGYKEGGTDEMISPKGITTSKKAYERFHAEGDADE